MVKKFRVNIRGKEIEVERLPNGKFKIPSISEFITVGLGSVWFDDCRISYQSEDDIGNPNRYKGYTMLDPKKGWNQNKIINNVTIGDKGRFPANLLVSDDMLNDGSEHKSGSGIKNSQKYTTFFNGFNDDYSGKINYIGDSGSFSRYFDLDVWWREQIKKLPKGVQKTFPFLIVPKASHGERNKGCEELNDRKVDYDSLTRTNKETADKFWAERKAIMKNFHPTVKPLKLMSYLVTLGSRENDVVLDPFLGSGTTAVACELLNRKWIGIELSPEYCNIARKRVEPWLNQLRIDGFGGSVTN